MDDQLRIGDVEREQAAAELAEHYAEGRLTTEEHAERLDRVWAARTGSDLLPIFRDLPGSPGPHGPAPTAGPRVRRGVPGPLLVVLVVLLVVSVATHLPVLLVGVLVATFVLTRHRRRGPWGCSGPR